MPSQGSNQQVLRHAKSSGQGRESTNLRSFLSYNRRERTYIVESDPPRAPLPQIKELQRALDQLRGQQISRVVEASPFSPAVLTASLPSRFRMPDMRALEGNSDMRDHFYEFNDLMEFHQVSNLTKYSCLAMTLTAHAKRWFRLLPPRSINSWWQMSSLFLRHFQANRKFSMSLSYLSNIRQEKNESLQPYINKFHRELNKVANTPEDSKYLLIENSVAVLNRHDPGPSTNAPSQREEYRRESSRRYDRKWANNDQRKGKKQRFEPKKSYVLVPRHNCDISTPLNASILAILDKSEEANLLRELKPMKKLASKRNGKKYCCYYQNNKHHTDECRAIKQAIKDLIQKGYFKEYVVSPTSTREKDQEDDGKRRRGRKYLYLVGTIFGGPHIIENSRSA
ncbi:uncharacterized protein LOC116105052 [Pistacia vera]|uniref:uncharacterized protein LOC116105052 n=1 Tax=Pistacia vera TaxID=55513 RepID=UPI0012634FA8|nr:uncharacterized protein LOC116105052 [Pistacia vera]